jgi:hypothetical protein
MVNEMLEKTIGILKTRVNTNLEIIKSNQKKIKQLLNEPDSDERNARLEKESSLNKKLLAENHDFINMQLSLINFIDKHKDTLSKLQTETKQEEGNLDYFNLTVSGEIPFNNHHPMYEDEVFFTELLEYYTGKEDYEMCSKLMDIKGVEKNF